LGKKFFIHIFLVQEQTNFSKIKTSVNSNVKKNFNQIEGSETFIIESSNFSKVKIHFGLFASYQVHKFN